MFSKRFMLFPTLKKKNWCKKKIRGGGGCWIIFFLEKQFFLISHFMLFSTLKKKILPLHLLVKWEVVSPNSRWGHSLLLILYLKCGGGLGGGCNVFLTFYAISNISRKKIWEYKPIISHLMFSSCFFLYAGNIEKCPFTYSYWLNGRWFLQIVDIGHFIMKLGILKSAPSLTG